MLTVRRGVGPWALVVALTSAEIDAMRDRALAAEKATTAPRTTDEEFLRRVCLDLTGKPPTTDQIAAFFEGGAARPNGRPVARNGFTIETTEGFEDLYGSLLNSSEFVSRK